MRKLIFIIPVSVLASCTVNETCREKSFKDYNWNCDNSVDIDNLRFGDDDTITVDIPPLSVTNYRKHYSFNEGCDLFTWDIAGGQHWTIIKNEGNIIWIKEDDGTEYHLVKQ